MAYNRRKKQMQIVNQKMELIATAIHTNYANYSVKGKAAFIEKSLRNQVEGLSFVIGVQLSSIIWIWLTDLAVFLALGSVGALTLSIVLTSFLVSVLVTALCMGKLMTVIEAQRTFQDMLDAPQAHEFEYDFLEHYRKAMNG
jgi:hypothetical protein